MRLGATGGRSTGCCCWCMCPWPTSRSSSYSPSPARSPPHPHPLLPPPRDGRTTSVLRACESEGGGREAAARVRLLPLSLRASASRDAGPASGPCPAACRLSHRLGTGARGAGRGTRTGPGSSCGISCGILTGLLGYWVVVRDIDRRRAWREAGVSLQAPPAMAGLQAAV